MYPAFKTLFCNMRTHSSWIVGTSGKYNYQLRSPIENHQVAGVSSRADSQLYQTLLTVPVRADALYDTRGTFLQTIQFFFFFQSSGGLVKVKLKLTILPRNLDMFRFRPRTLFRLQDSFIGLS